MNLTLYFRLICIMLFNKSTKSWIKETILSKPFGYNNYYFHCPKVFAKNGFSVSLQIHTGNYCESENGYRQLGHTWERVEFGFPSAEHPLFISYAEDPSNITETVGSIPITVLEQIFEDNGGIDWEKTLSVEVYNEFIK